MRFLLLLATATLFAHPVLAEELDPASKEGLSKTQEVLRDPKKRQEAIKGDKKAEEADARVQRLSGSPENTQKMYEISADIMENITKQSGGDPQKMQKLLEEAQKDPEAFYKSLTPEQRGQIQKLSGEISPQPQAKKAPGRQ